MKNKWTKTEIDTAITLHSNKLSFEKIGEKLNRTPKAVKIKLGRFGLKQNKRNFYKETICLNCNKNFQSLIKINRKFCSSSCSATYNNKIRVRKIKKGKKFENKRNRYYKIKNNHCLNCGNLVYNKFCNNICYNEYNKKTLFKKIEKNEKIKFNSEETARRWYKKFLVEKHGEKCMKCGWNEINPKSNYIPIQIEHKDGNSENNLLNNLELLCPNCHSLTPTFGILNKGNGREIRRIRRNNNKLLLIK